LFRLSGKLRCALFSQPAGISAWQSEKFFPMKGTFLLRAGFDVRCSDPRPPSLPSGNLACRYSNFSIFIRFGWQSPCGGLAAIANYLTRLGTFLAIRWLLPAVFANIMIRDLNG